MTTCCFEITIMRISVFSASMCCSVCSFIQLSNCNTIRGWPRCMKCHIQSPHSAVRLAKQKQQQYRVMRVLTVLARSHYGPVISTWVTVTDCPSRAYYRLVLDSNCLSQISCVLWHPPLPVQVLQGKYRIKAQICMRSWLECFITILSKWQSIAERGGVKWAKCTSWCSNSSLQKSISARFLPLTSFQVQRFACSI